MLIVLVCRFTPAGARRARNDKQVYKLLIPNFGLLTSDY